ncbi:MAG: Heme exporter protein D [Candidatus Tokpelaia sp. JSC188]|nr:MAG: Heme exporter protein D [Candidatus Tokpelaia sp. JSC188]
MTHLQYVIMSYVTTFAGFGGMLIWLLVNKHRQRSALQQLRQNNKNVTETEDYDCNSFLDL